MRNQREWGRVACRDAPGSSSVCSDIHESFGRRAVGELKPPSRDIPPSKSERPRISVFLCAHVPNDVLNFATTSVSPTLHSTSNHLQLYLSLSLSLRSACEPESIISGWVKDPKKNSESTKQIRRGYKGTKKRIRKQCSHCSQWEKNEGKDSQGERKRIRQPSPQSKQVLTNREQTHRIGHSKGPSHPPQVDLECSHHVFQKSSRPSGMPMPWCVSMRRVRRRTHIARRCRSVRISGVEGVGGHVRASPASKKSATNLRRYHQIDH